MPDTAPNLKDYPICTREERKQAILIVILFWVCILVVIPAIITAVEVIH